MDRHNRVPRLRHTSYRYTRALRARGAEKGANALRDFRKVCDETDEQVFKGFTDEEKETLMYFLKRLNMNIADSEMTKEDFKKIISGGDR